MQKILKLIVKVLKANHLTENSRHSGKQNFQSEILENLGLSDKVVSFLRKSNIIGKNVPFPAYMEFQKFLLSRILTTSCQLQL